jgi:hypothetical protein
MSLLVALTVDICFKLKVAKHASLVKTGEGSYKLTSFP